MIVLACPHPTELATLLKPDDHVEQKRNLFCENYDEWLGLAVERDWISWSCAGCVLFEHPAVAHADERRASDGYAELTVSLASVM